MFFSSLCHKWPKVLSTISHRYLATVSNRMPDDKPIFTEKVIQLCGNDRLAIHHAVGLLQKGEVIAVPTDTVFGLACDASNSSAINLLYDIKGRDRNKPLAICVPCVSEVKKWGDTSQLPKGLVKSLLPGPVTLLLNRKEKLNPDLNPGVKKVGIRCIETNWHPFLDFVVSALGYPVALTSANPSNEPNCIHVEEFKSLWPRLGAVFDTSVNMVDHGKQGREGSTIVDLTEPGKFKITRPGVGYQKTLKKLSKYGLTEST